MSSLHHVRSRRSRETSPLDSNVSRKATPLPKSQLAAIYAIKILVPIATTQIFPYLNVMVERIKHSDGPFNAYYSGMIASSFPIARLITIYPWARLSDSIGRKPVILVGTSGIAITSVMFGLSQTFTGVLLTRFLTGIFCGTIGAIHSVVGELSDSTNQSTAFPLYDICSALGFVIGPFIGGTFANPATEFPKWFDNTFFVDYPYFLPCLVTAVLAIIVSTLAFFVLDETLPIKRKSKQVSPSDSVESLLPSPAQDPKPKPLTIPQLLAIPSVRNICLSSISLDFIATCFNFGFVLVAYSSPTIGGLGLNPTQIGQTISIMGAISILLKLCMPYLLRRYDNVKLYSTLLCIWPFVFVSLGLLEALGRHDSIQGVDPGDARGMTGWMKISVGLILLGSRVGCLAFSIVMILIKESSPNPASLGATNGLAEFGQAISSALGPAIVSSLFALSMTHHVFGGHMWIVVITGVAIAVNWFPGRLRPVDRGEP
ncbi:hypothetical protein JAAARDRAFT_34978 [Jaapia argillacea MUCL 33604]|uniref:Major facilitator superfamily (MFS) profile domain-containing protein n=1 Tax=Jaapia argillacea MUCL 33604 TaxID=933084 RepID=A0A067PTV5_9AGAM|nr:hypothetical protein JAAARDRAFT_34978 [Jaapia argillacea MUCL 33604]